MKLAIAGKGGAGKTSISGTLARLMARRGRRVLAIDNDLNPNLSLTLGIPAARITGLPTFPAEIVRRNQNGVYELAMSLGWRRSATPARCLRPTGCRCSWRPSRGRPRPGAWGPCTWPCAA